MSHRKYDNYIFPLSLDDGRIIGIKCELNAESCFYFFQVYLQYANHSTELSREYIYRIQNIFYLYSDKGTDVGMDDFNMHLPKSRFRDLTDNRSLYFNAFLTESGMISINTLDTCKGAKSTFVTYDGPHESVNDHILIPVKKFNYIILCYIITDNASNVSNHRHGFCIRSIYSFPKRTTTDVALALLHIKSLEYEIDYRKLIFSCQLCRLSPEYRVKEIFPHRPKD